MSSVPVHTDAAALAGSGGSGSSVQPFEMEESESAAVGETDGTGLRLLAVSHAKSATASNTSRATQSLRRRTFTRAGIGWSTWARSFRHLRRGGGRAAHPLPPLETSILGR